MARVRLVLVVFLFTAIPILAAGVTAAHDINCGDTLGPGGYFQLQQNLDCSRADRGLILKDGAILDLNGHVVICTGFFPRAVFPYSERAHSFLTVRCWGRFTTPSLYQVTGIPLRT